MPKLRANADAVSKAATKATTCSTSAVSAIGWTAGVSDATRFNTSDDFDHLDNEVEGFVELTYGGFHTGLSATSLYQDPTDDVEIEVDLGYGADFGQGTTPG